MTAPLASSPRPWAMLIKHDSDRCPLSVRGLLILATCGLLAVVAGCSAASSGFQNPQASPAPPPQFGHVFLLVEENHSYTEVTGSASMPYFNSLASTYGLATQYYADFHPSISDYFMLTTGQPVTFDNGFTGTVSADNLVRELNKAGKTWKSYAESLPSVGYTGGDVYPYFRHHNPFTYLTDVQNGETANLVPFSEFASDLGSNRLPNFSFIVPNVQDDAHDGSLAQADSWLQQNVAPLISSAQFQKDGLLIITFDEGDITDLTRGGGHVATLVISPRAIKGHQSSVVYQHQSTLRLVLETLGVNSLPGAASVAAQMNEFLQ